MSSEPQQITRRRRRVRLLDVVALTADRQEDGLVCGHVGTVVEDLGGGVYEVEFTDERGRCYALVAVPATGLLPLYHRPVRSM